MRICLIVLSLLPCASGFITVQPYRAVAIAKSTSHRSGPVSYFGDCLTLSPTLFAVHGGEREDGASVDQDDISAEISHSSFTRSIPKALGTGFVTWVATAQVTLADSPDWGVFEGRTGSLLHPITMGSLLLFSIYTALLGFQWRRQRTIGDEIKTLQKSLPNLQGASSVTDAIKAAETAEETSTSLIATLKAALPVEQQIKELQQERKALVEAGPRDRHYSQGALLAFIGTAFAIVGPLNTYARAGKLFPGPHLYAGAGLVVLWALASSCVPAMQKGSDTARKIHIGANLTGLGLFGWQVVSGIPILQKVIEKTTWP